MSLIQANRCLLQLDLNGDYVTVMCLKSFTVNTDTDEKEITAPVDGKFKSFDYHTLSATINVDGVLVRDPTTNTMFDFAKAQLNFLELKLRVVYIAENGLPMVFKALCIVRNANIGASAGQVASGTAQLLASGEYTIEDALPQFVNLRIRLFGNPSIPGFFKFQLIDTTGTAIFQTDILPQASGGNLANPLDITVPVPKGNWYYWFQMNTNAIGNVFTLDAPPTKSSVFNNGVYNETSNGVQLYDFTADREVSVGIGISNPPPTCTAPSIASSNLPAGIAATNWTGTVAIAGTQPLTISNVVKPAWVNISESNGLITLSGTAQTGTNQAISFDVTNACGSVSFSGTVSIGSNPSNITANYTYTEPGSGLGANCQFIIFKNSVAVVSLNNSGSGNVQFTTIDQIEVRIFGPAFPTKDITVTSNIDGAVGSDTTGGQICNVLFTALAFRTYTITAFVL